LNFSCFVRVLVLRAASATSEGSGVDGFWSAVRLPSGHREV
jgi:hypothetical protein